ncbi:MAG TPA: IS1595 family transposase [Terriglobia bacterium]|nr:IS1595 family transposase [Terriglobia bacterium]
MKQTHVTPKTLLDAVKFFGEYENCQKFMVEARWPDGIIRCPNCNSERVTYMEKTRRWKCYGKHPRAQFTLKVGTIFEDSPIPLEKWLPTLWLIVNCKNGISSYEVARDLGVTQKTAWFMLHRLRLAMQTGQLMKLKGEVEVDETFIGGKARNMHIEKRRTRITGTGGKDKTVVMGFLQRGGAVCAEVVGSRKKKELQAEVKKHVQAGSALYSDALQSYDGLEGEYAHKVIDHAVAYVAGRVHTNGMENFWSLLKRGLKGTYVSVEPFHLFRYLDEQTLRFNLRKTDDFGRFLAVLAQVVNRRLTNNELIGATA